MRRPALALALALALLSLLATPGAFAHEDTGAHPLPFLSTSLDVTAAECGEPGEPCYHGDNDGALGTARPNGFGKPAGWYYGSVSVWAEIQAVGFPAPSGSAYLNVYERQAVRADYALFALAYALCDLEVLSAGTGPGSPEDERVVDGSFGGGAPDGTSNDGGIGGVCHTPVGFYDWDPFNTPGCSYGNAKALDALSGEDIWITTSCDYQTPAAAAGLLDHLQSLSVCIPSSILGGSAPGGTIECLNIFIGCAITGTFCPSPGATFCGADGVSDAGEAGQGDGGTPDGPVNGVPYPSAAPCSEVVAAAAAFAWNAAIVDFDSLGVTVEAASVATHGWIA